MSRILDRYFAKLGVAIDFVTLDQSQDIVTGNAHVSS